MCSSDLVETADEFIGQVLSVKVIRVDQRRNRAVFSHKAVLNEERRKQIDEIWETLNVDDIVEGKVMRFTEYGAFVDLGGIDGLLHISEISWGKLKHPEELLEMHQTINVRILSMNREKGKISLGLKQTTPEPWSIIGEKYHIGQIVSGEVVQLKEYGAFVELEPGLDGLVHISEVANKRVVNIGDELKIGQKIKAKILDIDTERRRISLSIKEALNDGEVIDSNNENPVEEASNTCDAAVELENISTDEVKNAETSSEEVTEAGEDNENAACNAEAASDVAEQPEASAADTGDEGSPSDTADEDKDKSKASEEAVGVLEEDDNFCDVFGGC